jgi:ribosomal protein S18 acetylase RimI-like enzyme
VAIAQLVRTGRDTAEIAFAVADEHQHRGIGSALTSMLLDDARAAGITEISALASGDNPAALALIRRSACILEVRLEGPEQAIRAAIA